MGQVKNNMCMDYPLIDLIFHLSANSREFAPMETILDDQRKFADSFVLTLPSLEGV